DAQHGDREECAAQPQDGIGDRRRQNATAGATDHEADRQQQRRRDVGDVGFDQAGGEGADTDERGIAEACIARKAAQDRPSDAKARGIEHQLADANIERWQHQRPERKQGRRGQHGEQGLRGTELHREGLKALPRMPVGRTRSSSTSSRNMVTLGKDGPMYWAVSVFTTPSSRPPIRAPAGLPTPPSTTTTKAFMVHSASSDGENGRMMPITMPAAPAKAADTAKVRA